MIFEHRVAVATKFYLAVLCTHTPYVGNDSPMVTTVKSKSFWL